MEECNENGDFSLAKKNYSIQLEEKIEEMRKTIEDLRQKVTEDREMLQKEKRENERLMEEVKLQRKLSMFHLPHCPAHSTPCPVHPFKKLSLHHDMGQYGTDSNDDLFHGDHTIGHSDHVTQSYKELVQNFKPQSRHGCEDLFVEHEAAPPQVEINSQPDSFTLLLSNQWCRQQSMAKAPQSLFEQKVSVVTRRFNQSVSQSSSSTLLGGRRDPHIIAKLIDAKSFEMLFVTALLLLSTNTVPHKLVYANEDVKSGGQMLIDFTSVPTLQGWSEMSDVIRVIGKSKAALVVHKTLRFQRAVLFTMLNPQPDGAGFAGFRTEAEWNLTDYRSLQLLCRGQGDYYGYKAVLRHKGENKEPFPKYELMFQAPYRRLDLVTLPLSQFEAYFRGRRRQNAPPLDTSQITGFEVQVYGGVYLPVKQAGTSSLEIDWVKAV